MGEWKLFVDDVEKDFDADYGFKVKSFPGTGHSPVINRSTAYALQDGALFTGQKMGIRTFTLIGAFYGSTTLAAFHDQRQALIKALSSRTVKINQKPATIKLKYTGGTVDKEIAAIYEGGLELAQFVPFIENDVPVRFTAFNTRFDATSDTIETLDTDGETLAAGYIRKYQNFAWSAPSPDVNGIVRAFAVASNGDVYVGGTFTSAGAVSNTGGIAKWDGTAWTALGTGISSGEIHAMAIDDDDNLYVVGAFNTVGGVANTSRIAKWDGSAWSALDAGLSSLFAYDVAIAPNGDVYACGEFSDASGVANTFAIACWDGVAWNALGTGITGTVVYGLAIAPNGDVYACGSFTSAGGVANTADIAKWDGSTWASISTGLTGASTRGRKVVYDPSNDLLYLTGSFTAISGVSANYAAKWNGTAWTALGTGLDDEGLGISYDIDSNELYIAGSFTTAGGTSADGLAKWDGSAWSALGQFSAVTIGVLFDTASESLWVGGASSTLTILDGYTYIDYAGTEIAYPVIKIQYYGGTSFTPNSISNITTGATINLDYALAKGERLTLDLRPGARSCISSFYGSVWNAINDDSDISSFFLQPDNNAGTTENVIVINSDEVGSPTVTATLSYRTAYRSLD